ncbi:unnamed protein product [Dovyalis caffra]|uniref:Glutamate--ammonia ligase n=1 Tax=Dovyalis caffra TaxID=77055 RepID=A0AAV1RRN6_9ROSI|nr:unnamed protein product [Dovyalis caffra]
MDRLCILPLLDSRRKNVAPPPLEVKSLEEKALVLSFLISITSTVVKRVGLYGSQLWKARLIFTLPCPVCPDRCLKLNGTKNNLLHGERGMLEDEILKRKLLDGFLGGLLVVILSPRPLEEKLLNYIARPACMQKSRLVRSLNGGSIPGQCEFQLEPAVGISAGDQLWVARYVLERITEIAGVVFSLNPQPNQANWEETGAHVNYR